ncbi:MAG TPA: DUF1835 domain-containing protein [Gemmatimonadaceae bacterium]|nr:DUF1835 domain-containing protein [Gemmatimonadaceae bacterium]
MQRLNITNGDSAAGSLSDAGIEGKIIAWRDVLHEGPVDSSLTLDELSRQRARFIAGNNWDDFAHVSGNFVERDRAIQHLDYFDEVVLWFEDDLYDQLQLIQLLDFFSNGAAQSKKISLIVVDGYIPPLAEADLRRLDEERATVRPEQLDLAKRAWKAFGSNDPRQIERILQESTSALPYLARALTRQLEEFPSTVNGLSRSEREALTAVNDGHLTPVAAFLEVAKKQESIFLGDLVFYSYLERLSGKDHPLITWRDGSPVVAPTAAEARDFVNGELQLTPLGRDVLAGKKDWQSFNTQTRWLGGVEIKPQSCWRWDPDTRRLVAPPPASRLPPPSNG